MTLTSQSQTSASLVSRLLAILDDSDLNIVALFFALGLLATIYFVMHLPADTPLMTQFP